MTDNARRLASKVVAGVSLLLAGCTEIQRSGGADERVNTDGLQANRTGLGEQSLQETPRVKPRGTDTHEGGTTPGPTPTRKPDSTPPNDPTPTADAATPTRTAAMATETPATPGGGNGSESWPPDSGTSASVSGGSTTGGSAGGSTGGGGGGESVSTPTGRSGSKSGDGSNDGSGDGSNDGSGDDSTGGPALAVVGTSGTAPLTAERTISLGASEFGYLCDADLDRAFVATYSFAAADGRPLNVSLLPHENLDPLRAGDAYRTHLTFSGLPSFQMGPFTLSAGRYAIVVEQADDSATTPVPVTFGFELLREA